MLQLVNDFFFFLNIKLKYFLGAYVSCMIWKEERIKKKRKNILDKSDLREMNEVMPFSLDMFWEGRCCVCACGTHKEGAVSGARGSRPLFTQRKQGSSLRKKLVKQPLSNRFLNKSNDPRRRKVAVAAVCFTRLSFPRAILATFRLCSFDNLPVQSCCARPLLIADWRCQGFRYRKQH